MLKRANTIGLVLDNNNISGPNQIAKIITIAEENEAMGEEFDDVQFGKIKVDGSQRAKVNC